MRYRSTMVDRPQTVALVEQDRARIASDSSGQSGQTNERGYYAPQPEPYDRNHPEPVKKILGFPKTPFFLMVAVFVSVLGIVAIVTGVVVSRKVREERSAEPPPEIAPQSADLLSGSSIATINSGATTMVLYQDPAGAIRYYICEITCDPISQNGSAGVVNITRSIKEKTPLAVAGNFTTEVHLFYMTGENRIYQMTWLSTTREWVKGTLTSLNYAAENSSVAAVEYAGGIWLYFQTAESPSTIQELTCSVAEQDWQQGNKIRGVGSGRSIVSGTWGEDNNISVRLWYFDLGGRLIQETPGVGAKPNETISALPFVKDATIAITSWPVGAVYHTTAANGIEVYHYEDGIWVDNPTPVTHKDEIIAGYKNPISAVQWFEGDMSRTRVFYQLDENLGMMFQSDIGSKWEYSEDG